MQATSVAPHDDWCALPPSSALISRMEMLDSTVSADPDTLTIHECLGIRKAWTESAEDTTAYLILTLPQRNPS